MSDPLPFGGWSPTLSGIIPTQPPPTLLEPPAILFEYTYVELKTYRMYSQPWIVREHYDLVQHMLEERIEFMKQVTEEAWARWTKLNL